MLVIYATSRKKAWPQENERLLPVSKSHIPRRASLFQQKATTGQCSLGCGRPSHLTLATPNLTTSKTRMRDQVDSTDLGQRTIATCQCKRCEHCLYTCHEVHCGTSIDKSRRGYKRRPALKGPARQLKSCLRNAYAKPTRNLPDCGTRHNYLWNMQGFASNQTISRTPRSTSFTLSQKHMSLDNSSLQMAAYATAHARLHNMSFYAGLRPCGPVSQMHTVKGCGPSSLKKNCPNVG